MVVISNALVLAHVDEARMPKVAFSERMARCSASVFHALPPISNGGPRRLPADGASHVLLRSSAHGKACPDEEASLQRG